MTVLRRAAAGMDRVSEWIGHAVSWLVLLMVMVGAFNAIARYSGRFLGVNMSSNAWLELQWYLFSIMFLLGGSWALQQDAHVRVDVLYGRLGTRGKAIIDLAGTVLFLLPFCAFALWVSTPSITNSIEIWEGSPDPGGLPRWPIKASLWVAFGLLFLQGLARGAHHLADLISPLPDGPPAPDEVAS